MTPFADVVITFPSQNDLRTPHVIFGWYHTQVYLRHGSRSKGPKSDGSPGSLIVERPNIYLPNLHIVHHCFHNSQHFDCYSTIRMPTFRATALATLVRSYERARAAFVVDQILDNDGLDVHSLSFLTYLHYKAKLDFCKQCRYLVDRKVRKSSINIFDADLKDDDTAGMNWMSDEEFKRKYRTSREHLDIITERIKGDDIFKKGSRGPSQIPVKHQLMIFLHFVGHEGMSNHTQRDTFRIGAGSFEICRSRVVKALCARRDEYIRWPDEGERKEIAARIEAQFLFPHCVGMMDGTLAELGIAPKCVDKADYSGRKFGYSLTINVINDDKRRIRAYLSGFPGCSHDNRVWKHMDLFQTPERFFTDLEYVLCDTAYEPSQHAIPAYKSLTGFRQDEDEQLFNTALARPRVISEHVMGMWKGRFPWLKKMRMLLTNDIKSLKRIMMYIDSTVILHNMLIDLGDDSDKDADWNEDDETLTDIDDAGRIPEEEVLWLPVPAGAPKDTRREQLKNLIREKYVPQYRFHALERDNSFSSAEYESSTGVF